VSEYGYGSRIEITERVLAVDRTLEVTKYRHHWQDSNGALIKRWDNAPHYTGNETFPHHLHEKSETNIIGHAPVTSPSSRL